MHNPTGVTVILDATRRLAVQTVTFFFMDRDLKRIQGPEELDSCFQDGGDLVLERAVTEDFTLKVYEREREPAPDDARGLWKVLVHFKGTKCLLLATIQGGIAWSFWPIRPNSGHVFMERLTIRDVRYDWLTGDACDKAMAEVRPLAL